MAKRSSGYSLAKLILTIVLAISAFVLLLTTILQGTNVDVLNPKGIIAKEQLHLILLSAGLMLGLGIPTFIALYTVAWKFRESNTKANYDPSNHHGKAFVVVIWAVPSVLALIIVSIMWPSTHKLDPRRAIASKENPITIQVVALRWKWLFIYPEQKIATVNFVQIPVDTPIEFDLTADETPMSSFWIPQLSGQLYAMTGHTNRLNVMATSKGDYIGKSAEINGAGFAGMKFITHATTRSEFEQWAKEVKTSLNSLDNATYDKLVEPSENNSLAFYNNVDLAIYDKVLMKYGGQHDHVEHK